MDIAPPDLLSPLNSTSDSLLSTIAMDVPDVDTDSCSLLGSFALVIQSLMGMIVLGSLLVKRHRERPRRKFRIWTADVSKQVIGQAFVHGLNVLISASIASSPTGGNPCALYFINILIDTTLGVFILYFCLRLCTHVLSETFSVDLTSAGLVTGHYPSPFLRSWARQLGLYLAALSLMKLSVIFLFFIGGDALVRFGDRIIAWISADPQVQVVVSVMVGPTLLNVLQFLLIDSFIRHKGDSLSPDLMETDDDAEAQQRFLGGGESEDSASDSEVASQDQDGMKRQRSSRRSFHRKRPGVKQIRRSIGTGATNTGPTDSTSPTQRAHSYPPSIRSEEAIPAVEDDGWDDDDEGWAKWADDDIGASGDKLGRVSTTMGGTRIGRGEKGEFDMVASPGTPRIVVTEPF